MAAAIVQQKAHSGNFTFNSPVTAGNWIIVLAGDIAAVTPPTATATFVSGSLVQDLNAAAGTQDSTFLSGLLTGSGTCTVTFGGSLSLRGIGLEISGLGPGPILGPVNSASGSSTTPSAGSITPDVVGGIALCGVTATGGSSYTVGAGWADFGVISSNYHAENQLIASLAAITGNMTMTGNVPWVATVAYYRLPAASAVVYPQVTIAPGFVRRVADWARRSFVVRSQQGTAPVAPARRPTVVQSSLPVGSVPLRRLPTSRIVLPASSAPPGPPPTFTQIIERRSSLSLLHHRRHQSITK